MSDIRPFRLRADLTFDVDSRREFEQLRDLVRSMMKTARNINEGTENQEIGFLEIERCDHEVHTGQGCEVLARWEVGKGRVNNG